MTITEIEANIKAGRCAICGKEFERSADYQIYCSTTCQNKARWQRKRYLGGTKPSTLRDSIEFECTNCGKHVVTDPDAYDKRSRFCSARCEKQYWRHKYLLDQRGMSSRTNFHSIEEYAAYERRTNAQ